jgi:hypothetical protein
MAHPKQVPPARFSHYDQILAHITSDVFAHPRNLSRYYTDKYEISRVTATKHLRRLEAAGWIARSEPVTHPVFSAGFKRVAGHSYAIDGLEEQSAWEQDFEPFFSLKPNIKAIAIHGFTEMVNNTIDHSEGDRVFIWMNQTDETLTITVFDSGIGIFRKISDALNLPDMRQALFELSKREIHNRPFQAFGRRGFLHFTSV